MSELAPRRAPRFAARLIRLAPRPPVCAQRFFQKYFSAATRPLREKYSLTIWTISGRRSTAAWLDLLEAVIRLNDKVPGLRIIVDHLPSMAERLETSWLPRS